MERTMLDFDTSVEVDGVTVTGNVIVNGNGMYIRMTAPYKCIVVIRGTFFNRMPGTESDARLKAQFELQRSYRRRCERMTERDSKTAEEWDQVANDAHERLRKLQVRMRVMHDLVLGSAKSDLKQGLISQRDYVESLAAFRRRTAEERENIALVERQQSTARYYAAELRKRCASGENG